MKPAVILSSYTMGLGVIRALGTMGVPIIVVYYDNQDMGYVSRFVRERIRAPHPEQAEDAFLDVLIELGERLEGGLLIPTSDATLSTVSRHKERLSQVFTVACTDWPITEQFLVKKFTYALADSIGVPAPRTVVPQSVEDVERYGRSVDYPCLVKPTQSHRFYAHFKTKMVKVENLEDLRSTYLQASDAGLEVMVQELIPGSDADGVNYNSYFWEGRPLVEFTAAKVRNAPPCFGSPRVAVSQHIPEVIDLGRELLAAMGFYGFSCTEFKKDARDGVYRLMEVNGRHNLSSLLAVRCGINFPWLHYRHLVFGELPPATDYAPGIYWIDLIRDVGYTLRHHRQERYSPRQVLRPYLEPHVFAVLDLKDLRPFIKRCVNLTKRGGNSR